MKRLHLLTVMVLLGAFCIQKAVAQDEIFEKRVSRLGQQYAPGEIIVKFKPEVTPDVIAILNSQLGTTTVYTSLRAGFKRLKIPANTTVEEMVAIYQASPHVEYAEANYLAYALMVPDDALYPYQWHLANTAYGGIQIEPAWNVSTGSEVVVAILDTGVAYELYHEDRNGWRRYYEKAPDLAKTCFVPGHDFVNRDSHPNDDSNPGHGTHIAGIIAQSTNNAVGTAGIAFDACLMPVKVLDSSGAGTHADVADGIIWATDNGAQVINLSLGGSQPSTTLENAVAYAYGKGVVLVAAAGNSGTSSACYPAAYDDYVIAVGATRYDETLAYYSNYGASLDLVAPGGDLSVDQDGDGHGDGILQQTYEKNGYEMIAWGYCYMEGTSMAAAHVSAVAALLIAEQVATMPSQVREALQSTAKDKASVGWDPRYGWGVVDALAALQWVPAPWPPQLTADFVAELTVGGVPLTVQFSDQSTGGIISWSWDFGDGETSAEQSPVHTYESPGSYTVSLTVTAADGSDTKIKHDYVTVTEPAAPEANFMAAPMSGKAPLTVHFSDTSKCYAYFYIRDAAGFLIALKQVDALGHVTDWLWDFGDGETSTERNPVHTYDQPGYYTVSLTVTSRGGSDTATKEDYIHATPPPPPIADFSGEPSSGEAPLITQFLDKTVGDVTGWLWDFGDGQTSTEQNPSHTYRQPGDYTVSLKAIGRGGSDTETKTKYVHVVLPKAHVSIDIAEPRSFGRWTIITTTVTIRYTHAEGLPFEGATVEGHWTGDHGATASGTTDANGRISFRRTWIVRPNVLTFTVDKVTKAEQPYELIGQTSQSINLR